jgi:hypothetical protein
LSAGSACRWRCRAAKIVHAARRTRSEGRGATHRTGHTHDIFADAGLTKEGCLRLNVCVVLVPEREGATGSSVHGQGILKASGRKEDQSEWLYIQGRREKEIVSNYHYVYALHYQVVYAQKRVKSCLLDAIISIFQSVTLLSPKASINQLPSSLVWDHLHLLLAPVPLPQIHIPGPLGHTPFRHLAWEF